MRDADRIRLIETARKQRQKVVSSSNDSIPNFQVLLSGGCQCHGDLAQVVDPVPDVRKASRRANLLDVRNGLFQIDVLCSSERS